MYIKVLVTPGAKKDSVEKNKKGELVIYTKKPAEQNLANRAVLDMTAEYFSVAKNKVKIINGHRSPRKMLSVEKEIE